MSSATQQLIGLAKARFDPVESKGVTFLFENDREAARMDREALFQLGVAGFQELVKTDQRFSAFERALFSPSAKEIRRTMETQSANATIDTALHSFLPLLSGYLTLPAAHKVMEYLVRHLQVHLLNVSDVLAAFLPYHETALFPRILAVLNLQSAPLSPLRIPGFVLA